MIKRIDSIRFERNNRIFLFLVALLTICALSYYQFILASPSKNFFAWIFYNFQNLYTVGLAFPILYLLLINSQFSFSFNEYSYISRLHSRRELFLSDVITVFKTTLLYITSLVLICVMMGVLSLEFDNTWSPDILMFFETVLQTVPNQNISIVVQLGLAIVLLFMYLLTIGNCFNLLYVYFKKKSVDLVILFFVIGIQTYFFKIPTNGLLNKMMPIYHYLVYLERFNENSPFISIGTSLCYWIILLFVNYVLLYLLYQRTSLGERK